MELYMITNDQFVYQTAGESNAMVYMNVYKTYSAARRAVNQYTKWSEVPTLQRKVVPLKVINELRKRKTLSNNAIIASFKGTNHRMQDVWFSISLLIV